MEDNGYKLQDMRYGLHKMLCDLETMRYTIKNGDAADAKLNDGQIKELLIAAQRADLALQSFSLKLFEFQE